MSKVITLCQKGMREEKNRNMPRATILYNQAWKLAKNNYEKCVAAHFVARVKNDKNSLEWNMVALKLANKVKDTDISNFYPSLYLCISLSYEKLKKYDLAKKYLDLSFNNKKFLSNDDYGKKLKTSILNTKRRLARKTY